MSCSGCSVSVLNALSPGINNALIDEIVPGSHICLLFHPTVMAGAGEPAPETPRPPGESTPSAAEDSLAPSGESRPPPRRGRTVAFRGLTIQDGTLDILLPAPPSGLSEETTLTEAAPDGTSGGA